MIGVYNPLRIFHVYVLKNYLTGLLIRLFPIYDASDAARGMIILYTADSGAYSIGGSDHPNFPSFWGEVCKIPVLRCNLCLILVAANRAYPQKNPPTIPKPTSKIKDMIIYYNH